jgi:hypothetical protein
VAIFLPFTHQKPEEPAVGSAEEAARLLRRVVDPGMEEPQTNTEESGGIDITTTKLLGILACLSLFALLWEQVTCLDGPNALQETANDDYLSKADDGNTPRVALSTPEWKGEGRFVPVEVASY